MDNLKKLWAQYPDIRFCRVLANTKRPFEKDWPNKDYDFNTIKTHIENGENYGVLAGPGNLVIIDCDEVEVYDRVKDHLPESLTVKTGKGHHVYFFCEEIKEKIVLTAHDKHWGEVQSYGAMCVGPGSTHPSGSKYEILFTKAEGESEKTFHPIETISYPQLLNAVKPFDKESVEAEKSALFEQNNYDFDEVIIDDIKITDIWTTAGMKQQKGGEYYGEHPVHGSTTGMNFWLNPDKNTWKCFRCGTGGGALSAIAVAHGIMDCSECLPGALRDEKVKQAIEIAKEKGWGVSESLERPNLTNLGTIDMAEVSEKIKEKEKAKPKEMNLETRKFTDFRKLKKDNNYFVKGFILPKTVTMVYSPPGQFKSFLSLYLAMSISVGKSWLNLETKENNVLYLDAENNDQILKERMEGIFKGNGFEENEGGEPLPRLHIAKRVVLMDNKKNIHIGWVNALAKKIRDEKIKIVFLDTLHRYCGYDENSSDDVNKLYTEIFQPLIEEFGVSIVFLHHSSKAGGYRGSGDFLGMVDTAYSVTKAVGRPGDVQKGFTFRNEKNRAGEQELITGNIEFETIPGTRTEEDGKDNIIVRINATDAKKTEQQAAKEMIEDQQNNILSIFDEGVALKKAEIVSSLEAIGVSIPKSTFIRRMAELREQNKVLYNEKDRTYALFIWGQQKLDED